MIGKWAFQWQLPLSTGHNKDKERGKGKYTLLNI